MTQSLPLVKLSLLRPFASELRSRDIHPEPVFESVGLSEDMTHDPGLSVHVMVATQFVENAAEMAEDRFLAARVAANLDLDGWPVLARAEARATTVGEYLSIFVSTANEVASSAEEYLHLNGTMATLGERRVFEPTILPAQNDAFMAVLGCAILRRALRDRLDPAKVTIVVSDPKVLPPEYGLMHPVKGARMGFRLRFPSAWLWVPFDHATAKNGHKPVADTDVPEFVRSFRQMLRAHVGKGSLTAARCAELASMIQQKLKRRLASHQTDISREIDVVQQEYARDALAETDRSIADIAASLGFSDSANFTRAFRRSNGLTPPSSGNRIKARTIRLLDPPWNRPFGLPDALSGRSAVRALTGDHFPHVQRRSPFAGCTAASKQGLLTYRRARHCPACSKEPCRT